MRREASRQRAGMSADADALEAFTDLFFQHVSVEPKTVVAAYWPKEREFDIGPVIEEILKRGSVLCLPVVEKGSKILTFAAWDGQDSLVKGAFGVLHPPLHQGTRRVEPDVVIVPLLAFDRRGYRLGYGGGYYDATLTDLKARKTVVAVGAGYAQQACLFNLPTDAHDVRLDLVITPQQAYTY